MCVGECCSCGVVQSARVVGVAALGQRPASRLLLREASWSDYWQQRAARGMFSTCVDRLSTWSSSSRVGCALLRTRRRCLSRRCTPRCVSSFGDVRAGAIAGAAACAGGACRATLPVALDADAAPALADAPPSGGDAEMAPEGEAAAAAEPDYCVICMDAVNASDDAARPWPQCSHVFHRLASTHTISATVAGPAQCVGPTYAACAKRLCVTLRR